MTVSFTFLFLTCVWAILSLFFLLNLNHLLLLLLVLEINTFIILFFICIFTSCAASSDLLLLAFFSVFVIEGVIALSGLIALVSFSGSDYISSSSVLKC